MRVIVGTRKLESTNYNLIKTRLCDFIPVLSTTMNDNTSITQPKHANCLPAMPFLLPTTTNAENDILRPRVPVMFITVLNYKWMTTHHQRLTKMTCTTAQLVYDLANICTVSMFLISHYQWWYDTALHGNDRYDTISIKISRIAIWYDTIQQCSDILTRALLACRNVALLLVYTTPLKQVTKLFCYVSNMAAAGLISEQS